MGRLNAGYMEILKIGQRHTALVEGYSSEGYGVVVRDGAVVFVPRAIGGETVDFKIDRVMKTHALGELVRVQTPSPERTAPDCSYYGKCGGCDFRHLSYTEELWAKHRRVQDALTRIGGSGVSVEEILGAKNPDHYRNKCQYPVGPHGETGFFRARTHQVVPVDRCLLQPEVCDRTAQATNTPARGWSARSTCGQTAGGKASAVWSSMGGRPPGRRSWPLWSWPQRRKPWAWC